MRILPICLLVVLANLIPAVEWVWIEAERPSTGTFDKPVCEPDHGATVLSGGLWVGRAAGWKGDAPFLEYEVQVPAAGRYELYARKFWKHGPYRWRVGDGAWQSVDRDLAMLDSENLRPNWNVNWTYGGLVELSPGTHRLRIELTDPSSLAYFDCFVLTKGTFIARGPHKPDEAYPAPPSGWQTFTNDQTLLDPSPIDLRGLNEPVAGQGGFITRDGERFVQGNKTVRLLGAGVVPEALDMPPAQFERQAAFLARKGINLVRLHTPLCVTSGPKAGDVDERRLDTAFRAIATWKSQGMYSLVSIYFQHWFDPSQTTWLPGYAKGQKPYAVHFWNEAWQARYRNWFKALLTRTNPYTGTRLVDDPALMGLELLNEDSLFFWTFEAKNIPEPHLSDIEGRFGAWLSKRYGSLQAAFDAWKSPLPRDNPKAGRAAFQTMYQMGRQQGQREQDTARFLAEVQRAFFVMGERYLRDELGFKGLICASNWRTAQSRVLGPIDKWTNDVGDFTDHHGYVYPFRKRGPGTYYESPGDQIGDRSLARWDGDSADNLPRRLDVPFLCSTINGKPAMVSEYDWRVSGQCRAEMQLISGALASQAGIDAMLMFCNGPFSGWSPNLYFNQSPHALAMSPAQALMYRQGLVAETEPVARIRVDPERMYDLKPSGFTDPSAGDGNRKVEGAGAEDLGGLDVRAFALGKVTLDFIPGEDQRPDFSTYHDQQAGVLTGAGKQIRWRHKDGLFEVRAPGCQAVTGFLAPAGAIDLGDMVVRLEVPFGLAWAVSMDGNPLATSGKILLQVMSEAQTTGWATTGSQPATITSVGAPPILIRSLVGDVSFKRPDAAALTVTALDVNGCPVGRLPGGAARITLRPAVIYYLIER